jgi:hypothetical protein
MGHRAGSPLIAAIRSSMLQPPAGQPACYKFLYCIKELIAMITAFTARRNAGSTPFHWVQSVDKILAKAERKPRSIGHSGH